MTMPSTINTVKSMLSAARMGTYERVLDEAGNPISLAMALELYVGMPRFRQRSSPPYISARS